MSRQVCRLGRILSWLLVGLLTSTLGAEPAKKALTLEAIFDGSLSTPEPSQLRWASDGRLTFVADAEAGEDEAKVASSESAEESEANENGGGRELWALDPASGERQLLVARDAMGELAPSASELGLDERERTRRSRFRVPPYHLSADGQEILFTTTGQVVLHDLQKGETRILAPSKKGVLDPKFSPDGKHIAFVWQHDIWLVPRDGGEERQLTRGGHSLLLHGDLDWVYPEELGVRTGYHFSPDGQRIAFLEMDESSVPTYPITEQVSWQATVDLQRYPKPGDPNPRVRVGIVDVTSARTVWIDRSAEYIPRIDWADDDHLAVQLLNRGQDELELVMVDPTNGRSRSVFFERDEHWVDVTDDLDFMDDGEHFLWTSFRSGLRHIYLYRRDGELVRQLTDGEFRVTGIEGVDEAGGWIYYSANEDNLLGSDLYRVKLDGSSKERLTQGQGSHSISMSPAANAWMAQHTALSINHVPVRTVHDVASGRVTELARGFDYSDYALVKPELIELETPDGALVRVQLMKPDKIKRRDKRPMLIYVYGMAGVPTIRDSRRGARRFLFHQFLVQQGYVVAHVDDRSSSTPGHKHAVLADQNIGPLAAADAGIAVEYFKSLPYVDGERLAIWGWSGGGFTTAFQLGHTNHYKVGIAGAPVTDWRLYDSIYTERYMGQPGPNAEAYERTSAINGAKDVEGRLLFIHGTHDDNVHLQNTLKMIDELVKHRKRFDLMLYPNKTHGITGTDHNIHMYRMIYEYLEQHL